MFRWVINLWQSIFGRAKKSNDLSPIIEKRLEPLIITDLRGELPTHPDKKYRIRNGPFTHIAIHHSLTDVGSAASFNRYHIENNDWPGIGYAYVISKDGTIEWCWDHNIKTYHVGNSNGFALGLVNVGDYNSTRPPLIQVEACLRLIQKVAPDIPVDKVWGHQEYPNYEWKKCPGNNWNMEEFRNKLQLLKEGRYKFKAFREV